jgi:hypothetical protein
MLMSLWLKLLDEVLQLLLYGCCYLRGGWQLLLVYLHGLDASVC